MSSIILNLRRREYALLVFALTCYCLLESHITSRRNICKSSALLPNQHFVNDITLEFAKFGFDCLENGSNLIRCKDATVKNSTRMTVNGKMWESDVNKSPLEPILEEQQSPPNKLKIKTGPDTVISKLMKEQRRPTFKLLDCKEIETLFLPDSKSEFADQTGLEVGIVTYSGSIQHPTIGRASCIVKKVNTEANNGVPYRTLSNEKEKREMLGVDTKVTGRLLGQCLEPTSLTLLIEEEKMLDTLCDEEQNVPNYVASNCFRNEKLISRIESASDKTRAAFAFIKELLCVFAELEQKKFFVHDIHGRHISISSNFSVRINNIENLVYHGSRNILSGGTCKYDENCPAPIGQLWLNGTANRVVYEKCNDVQPVCTDTSCTGYNSSLHMCGVARWILQPLYSYFVRLQDRSRMTHIMMSSMNSWPFLRKPALDSCAKATGYLNLYDKDMEILKQQETNQKRRFHVGPKKPNSKL